MQGSSHQTEKEHKRKWPRNRDKVRCEQSEREQSLLYNLIQRKDTPEMPKDKPESSRRRSSAHDDEPPDKVPDPIIYTSILDYETRTVPQVRN